MRTDGYHASTCRGLCIQLIEFVFQFAGELRTRPMTAFVVDDVIRVDRIRHDYERLVPNRDQERLIPTDIVDVIDKPEVLQDLECARCATQPESVETYRACTGCGFDRFDARLIGGVLLL